ncbi:MAG: YciI family protein [Brevibacterium sp.]|uniref:YCII-related domain-containing protein n=1 Tax=Brevibacterium aurantiacum TaxID=273384 RepID=A0A2A3Z9W1_BREAU|nr:YciI family protein [Brevibacterium aurantiacum]PCC48314.1 hypothetical protein CIK64_01020 [Brevibacterium aurantiacum]
MRYSLVFHSPEPGADGAAPSEEDIEETMRLMNDYGEALTSAGVFVAWEMLAPQSATTTVTRRTGSVVIEDGPFAATKEALAGVVVIDVADKEAALAWAEKFPGTAYGSVEVRAAATSYIDGRWVQP